MSQDAFRVFDEMIRAWSARDIEGVVARTHPRVKFWTSGAFPGLKTLYEGHDGIRQFWEDFATVFESLVMIPERYVEAGDRFAALWRFEGRGLHGVSVEWRGGHVVRVEDGLVTELTAYGDWEGPLAAIGAQD